MFTGHKLRQYPHAGGSCLAGVSRWDDDLADAGLRLLQELRFHGVSQVEFKRDPRDGRYCLMEVNARHWKWHGLAAACGVNLSLAAYSDAIGQPLRGAAPDGRRQVDRGEQGRAAGAARDRERRARRRRVRRSLRGTRIDGLHSLRDPVPGLLNALDGRAQVVTRRRARGRTCDGRMTRTIGRAEASEPS